MKGAEYRTCGLIGPAFDEFKERCIRDEEGLGARENELYIRKSKDMRHLMKDFICHICADMV